MKQNSVIIVESIQDGKCAQVERDLARYDPILPDGESEATCNPEFDFGALANLHLASFLIIKGEADADLPVLVFEATFDGPVETFIRDMIALCRAGLVNSFGRCVDAPDFATAPSRQLARYLTQRIVASNLSFSGYPGKTVAQIKGEARLRNRIADEVDCYRRTPWTIPSLFNGIIGDLLNRVVRRGDRYRWAEESPNKPLNVQHGALVFKASAVGFVLIAGLLLGILLDGLGWLTFGSVWDLVTNWPDAIRWQASSVVALFNWIYYAISIPWLALGTLCTGAIALIAAAREDPSVSNAPLNRVKLGVLLVLLFFFVCFAGSWAAHAAEMGLGNAPYALVILIVAWIAFRWVGLALTTFFPDTRDLDYRGRAISQLVRAAAFVAAIALAMLAVDLLYRQGTDQIFSLRLLGSLIDQSSSRTDGHALLGLVGVVSIALCLIAFRWIGATIRIPLETRYLRPAQKTLLTTKLHFTKVLTAVTGGFLLFYVLFGIRSIMPGGVFLSGVADLISGLLSYVLALSVYGALAILLLYGLYLLAVMYMRFREISESKRYQDPAILTRSPLRNMTAIGREEHGINLLQNHLASVTHVKPGRIRQWLLRLTLWVINLMAKWMFTRGHLSGIPTILYANWALINGGRRLLFVTNYCGSWESYLNEFIDMGAVEGLNAIWTHTHLRPEGAAKPVGFPVTKGVFWEGAQNARPFKAYVRKSQVQTRVWYSAYPTLSIRNIVDNGALRDGLLEPQAPGAAAGLLRKL